MWWCLTGRRHNQPHTQGLHSPWPAVGKWATQESSDLKSKNIRLLAEVRMLMFQHRVRVLIYFLLFELFGKTNQSRKRIRSFNSRLFLQAFAVQREESRVENEGQNVKSTNLKFAFVLKCPFNFNLSPWKLSTVWMGIIFLTIDTSHNSHLTIFLMLYDRDKAECEIGTLKIWLCSRMSF